MIDHQIWVFTCFNRNFPDKFMRKVVSLSSKQVSVAGGRCSRGFPRGAGAFLPWQWISWRSMEVSISDICKSRNPNMLISVISLQILSKFINETSGYHQYIINIIMDIMDT